MPKYKVEHYESKIRRHFNPLIEEQELLVKQFKTDATKRIVGKLSKKMGADKILDAFRKAEEMMKKARQDATTFFKKKAKQDDKKSLTYSMRNEEISLKDCEEQLREWAKSLVDRELRRRPEGAKLKQLEQLRQHSIDTVMESGTPEELIKQLDNTTKKIGIAWVVDTSKIKQMSSQ